MSRIIDSRLTPQLRHHMVASVAQLVEHRSRKAGVTGSSPVAGSIAQDSRLRAAFLLPISGAHPPEFAHSVDFGFNA